MSDNSTQSIGRIEGDARSIQMYQMFQSREATEAAAVSETASPTRVESQAKAEKPEEKSTATAAAPLLPVTQSDVMLKFRVDDKSKQITVFVVDKTSRRVLRTIPPDEVNKLKAGDLLKLLA